MSAYETASLYISILAAIISVASAVYAGVLNKEHSSSDYNAKEQVKSDTAQLISTLRSFMHKGALLSITKSSINIEPEKNAIAAFMNSQTGFAYYAWIDKKNSQAKQDRKQDEHWRLFFIYLAELANADDVYLASRRATDIELLFDDLTEDDLLRIANFNSDLIKAISENAKNRQGNIVIKTLVEMQKEKQDENSRDKLFQKLLYLKNMGIVDVNVEMFLATMSGNAAQLEAALQAGADIHMTDSALLHKYKNELKNYNE